MKKKGISCLVVVLLLAIVAGCAEKKAYVPSDVMSQVKAERLVQKADNMAIVFDKSESMNTLYNNASRLSLAKKATSELVQTIPSDLKLNSELRMFGQEKIFADDSTWLALPWTTNRSDLQKAVDNIGDQGLGRTPAGLAMEATYEDLKKTKGKAAIYLVSDFENTENLEDIRPKGLMDAIAKIKAAYGENACIYPIQVGKDPKGTLIANEVVKASACGFVENADNLKTPAAMAAFVQKTLYEPASPAAAKAAAAAAAAKPGDAAAPMTETPTAKAAAEAAKAAPPAVQAILKELQIPDINFDYDKYNLTPQAQAILKAAAPVYLKYKDYKLVVEGHCDERGTVEYNLALGQKRADEAAKYLADLGIEKERIKTISYGKEMPLVKESNETAWAKNRRAHFVIFPPVK
jgi:peptidoglycan-associated lipoprotein